MLKALAVADYTTHQPVVSQESCQMLVVHFVMRSPT